MQLLDLLFFIWDAWLTLLGASGASWHHVKYQNMLITVELCEMSESWNSVMVLPTRAVAGS